MYTFKDTKGREWDVTLDLLKARRITASDFSEILGEGKGKLNILHPEAQTFTRILTNPDLLFAVIWAMVRDEQARKYPDFENLNNDAAELEFVSAVRGSTITAAREAFSEALADFFPDLRIVLSTFLKQLKGMDDKVATRIAKIDPLLDQMIEQEMDQGIERFRQQLLKNKSEIPGEPSSPSPLQPGSATLTSGSPAIPSGT